MVAWYWARCRRRRCSRRMLTICEIMKSLIICCMGFFDPRESMAEYKRFTQYLKFFCCCKASQWRVPINSPVEMGVHMNNTDLLALCVQRMRHPK